VRPIRQASGEAGHYGLALVADASGFDDEFRIFALVLFPIVLFLGLATYVRIVQINHEDIYLVGAMNRLRRAYVDSAPEVREYFTSGLSDDEAGVWATYLLGRPRTPRPWGTVPRNDADAKDDVGSARRQQSGCLAVAASGYHESTATAPAAFNRSTAVNDPSWPYVGVQSGS
jgi:hypothetical protein